MSILTKTHIGLRNENQDNADFRIVKNGILGVLCDGMGGGFNGKEAAVRANERFCRVFAEEYEKAPKIDDKIIQRIFDLAMFEANEAVFITAAGVNMGTTLVAAFVVDDVAYISNIGDSRAYSVGDKICQITVDHSMVQLLFDSGQIQFEEIRSHPKKNVLTKVVGMEENIKPDFFKVKLNNAKILLCSDGLTNPLTDTEILQIFQNTPIDSVPDLLISSALANGGSDNITILII